MTTATLIPATVNGHTTATVDNGHNRRFYLLTARQAGVFVSYLWDKKLSFPEFWAEAQTMTDEGHNPAGFIPEQGVYYTWSGTTVELVPEGVQIGIPEERDKQGRTHRNYLEIAYAGMEYFSYWNSCVEPQSQEAKRVGAFMKSWTRSKA
jgi:hypothetical protein